MDVAIRQCAICGRVMVAVVENEKNVRPFWNIFLIVSMYASVQ